MDQVKVTALYLYPIKSCRGIALAQADVRPMGIVHDRRWMLVDDKNVFISQRTFPKLATISLSLNDGHLEVGAPESTRLIVPISNSADAATPVRIWKDTVNARRVSSEADTWFSSYLGASIRLVQIPEEPVRRVDQTYAQPQDHVGFADAFPLLLIAEESLNDLNRRLDQPLPMNRFRPNIVIQGGGAFGEDFWKKLKGPNISLRLVKPCARCTTTTVDQSNGSVGEEPLVTLATFRKKDGKVMFGQNVIPDGRGQISVGDIFEPVAR